MFITMDRKGDLGDLPAKQGILLSSKMNRKGDLTAKEIVTIVLVVFSLIVVFVFLFLIDFGGQSDEEVCHLSVMERATVPSVVQQRVPLKCKADKICLTDKGSDACIKEFGSDKTVEPIKLRGSYQEMADKIEEVTANEMYDCWSMMGEGKVDLFPNLAANVGFGEVKSNCVICSRVAVDIKDLNTLKNVTEKINLNDYLQKTQVPRSSLTYLQTFTDKSVGAYAKADISLGKLVSVDSITQSNSKPNEQIIETPSNQIAFVFMQVKAKNPQEVLTNMLGVGATVAGAAFMTPILGTAMKKVVFTPAGAVVTIVAAGSALSYGYANAIQNQEKAVGYCGGLTSSGSASDAKGCSMVQAVAWDDNDINALCPVIEGEI